MSPEKSNGTEGDLESRQMDTEAYCAGACVSATSETVKTPTRLAYRRQRA